MENLVKDLHEWIDNNPHIIISFKSNEISSVM